MVMRLQHRLSGLSVLLALAGMVLPAVPVTAQEPTLEREEAFVYATTHFNGLTYGSSLVTGQVETIYMLADVENVIAPRNTLIYYWPLTNEFFADWIRKNELVEGTLEVMQGGELIREVNITDFVIQYDSGDIISTIELYSAEAAHRAFDIFLNLRGQYRAAVQEHYGVLQAWRDEITALVREHELGTLSPDDLPPRPEEPLAFTLFSTDPIPGYVLSLPEGSYRIQMRLPDGSILPDSRKRLVVYDARRDGVAYRVTPKSRWTRPEESGHPNDVIYARPGTTVYLRPFAANEYNALYYNQMNDPQRDAGLSDRYLWVLHEPMAARLAQVETGGRVEEVDMRPYYVRQLATDSRGYDIIEWTPEVSESPSFDGFRVDVPADVSTAIQLVGGDGGVVPGSTREVRALYTERAWAPYLLSGAPLVTGIALLSMRRRRTWRLKKSDIKQ